MAINNEPEIHKLIICANVFVRKGDKYLLLKRSSLKKWAPNVVHPIGGKVDLGENPLEAARRELFDESGVTVSDVKLEAVVLERNPTKTDPYDWMIFHFSGDYESGEVKECEEGELVWLTADQIKNGPLFPSVRKIIDRILNPEEGTVFTTCGYNEEKTEIVKISSDSLQA